MAFFLWSIIYSEVLSDKAKIVQVAFLSPCDTNGEESAKNKLLAGPNEIDLVRSGLDDTMRVAYSQIKEQELSNSKINDRRTAAYALAIRNIADIYESMYL